MRGFVWRLYTTDDGGQFALRVDADYADQADRGWAPLPSPPPAPLPRGWRPRVVIGIDALGNQVLARIGSTTSPLWNGIVSTFAFESTVGTLELATVIAKRGERLVPLPE